uniref:tetratricopeptide repeat protein n=1 Tax=Trichocoleus desertorum TaxID=1481672 RepID=UPI0025B54560|nr:tetratricopeptide repeat protein [Trichocoleus desertorum]
MSEATLEMLSSKKAKAEELFNLGVEQYKNSNFIEANDLYEQALEIFQTLDDFFWLGRSLNAIGLANYYYSQEPISEDLKQKSVKKATTSYKNAIVFFQKANERKRQAVAYINLGLIYELARKNQKVIEVYQKAISIFEKISEVQEIASTFLKIARFYRRLDNYSEALPFYQKSQNLFQDIKNPEGEALVLEEIGSIYVMLKSYSEAFRTYQDALEIFKSLNINEAQVNVLIGIGDLYFAQAEEIREQSQFFENEKAFEKYHQSLNFFYNALSIASTSELRRGAAIGIQKAAEMIERLFLPPAESDGQSPPIVTGDP